MSMIYLIKESVSEIVLTLNEKQLLTNPNYLFRFINRSTNEEILFNKLSTDNTSLHKDRFDSFSITTSDYFNTEGEYTYFVYEQESETNQDYENLNLLETGIARINDISIVEYKEHESNNIYIL